VATFHASHKLKSVIQDTAEGSKTQA